MSQATPVLTVLPEVCRGRMHCVEVCPTQAIRVPHGKVQINAERCISCGSCIAACREGAIRFYSPGWEAFAHFDFKIAIPSPALLGQFPSEFEPEVTEAGLLELGFDAVYDLSIAAEVVHLATRDYLDQHAGPFPLISSSCPVVVRLIQVLHPDMTGQILPIEAPRDVAARAAKREYSALTGVSEDRIATVYITPCPGKVAAIYEPAEGEPSWIDAALSIAEIYNPLYGAITRLTKQAPTRPPHAGRAWKQRSRLGIGWANFGWQSRSLKPGHYLQVAQLANVLRALDDIEKGKSRNVDFVECYACLNGCVGGPLTVENTFVGHSRIARLIDRVGDDEIRSARDEALGRYQQGEYRIRAPILPRPIQKERSSFTDAVRRMKVRDRLLAALPGVDCGLCGTPGCAFFADDAADDPAIAVNCVFLSPGRMEELRGIYFNKSKE